ncbi:hypothetical protein niasHT_003697 [Heterodera trifolii]|uniref:DUF8206 domain-containing protein n=1 Tax=Heterodera trifolii TaxID=157864 RepID=A0ABD2M8Z8_9BILA
MIPNLSEFDRFKGFTQCAAEEDGGDPIGFTHQSVGDGKVAIGETETGKQQQSQQQLSQLRMQSAKGSAERIDEEKSVEFVAKKQTGDRQQDQIRRMESEIGPKKLTDTEQHQKNSAAQTERFNPTIGQMTQNILSEHFETPIGELMAQFDIQIQIRDTDFGDARFVDMEKNWSAEPVDNRGAYKVLLHPKMGARRIGHGHEEGSNSQMINRQNEINRFLLSSDVKAPLANLYDALTDTFATLNDHEFVNKMMKNNINFTVQSRPNLREEIIEIKSFADLKERTKMLGIDQKLSVISQLAHLEDVSPLGQFLQEVAAQSEHGDSFGFIKIVPKMTFSLKLNHPKVRDFILQQLAVENATHFAVVFVDPSIGNCATDLSFINGLNCFAEKFATAKGTKHPTPISFSLIPLSSVTDKTLNNPIPTHMLEDERQFEWLCGHAQIVNDYEWQLRKVRQSLNEYFIVNLRTGKAEHQQEEGESMVQRAVDNYVQFCQCLICQNEELVDEKKKMANELKQKGITYFGRASRQQLDSHFALNDSNSSIFHFVLLRNSSVPPLQNHNISFLLCLGKLFEFVTRGKCSFVDLNILRHGEEAQADEGLPGEIRSLDGYPNIGIRLIKMRGNKLLSNDYMAEEERKLQYPIARIENIRRTEVGAVPEADPKDIHACIFSCPFCEGYGGKCPNTLHFWVCDDCCQTLTFVKIVKAQITHFFCACGKTPVDAFSFRCSDMAKHGTEFKQFGSKASLDKELDRLNNKGMLNILLLGETGIGKSMLINALIAYLKHGILQEALEAKEIDWVIPSRFCTGHYDSKGNRQRIEVQLGEESKDERLEAGESQTKWPNAYVITTKDGHKVRIIDTPGIRNTDGVNEDNINLDKTLSFISTLPELHAVCILMRANWPLATPAFKYCIDGLFTYLHKNTTKNIVFVFTNASGSNYGMGNTDKVLEKILTPIEQAHNVSIPLHRDRVYCVDNEAYEALCLIKKAGIEYDQEEMDNFSRSWAHAEKEFRRLFRHVYNLKPHRTLETVSVNEARRAIIDLSEPLALITEKIQTNLDRTKKYEEAIKLGKEQIENAPTLETIEFIPLPHPRNVCTASRCNKTHRSLTGDVKLYTKICHEPCYDVKNITPELFPNEGLKKCSAMDETNRCRHCGCDWSVHMHYHFEQRIKTLTLEEVEQKLTSFQREALSTSENFQKQMLEVRGIISQKVTHFCAFLKKWALKPYNDSTDAYMHLSIKQAEKMLTECKGAIDERLHEDKLKGFRESLRLFRVQKELIDNATGEESNAPTEITAEDVKKLFDELYELPIFGADIRQMFETKQKSRHAHQKEYSEKKTNVGVKLRPTKSGKGVQPTECLSEEQRKDSSDQRKRNSLDYFVAKGSRPIAFSGTRPFSAIVHPFALSLHMTTFFSPFFRPMTLPMPSNGQMAFFASSGRYSKSSQAFSTISSRANFIIVICNSSNYDFVVPFDLTNELTGERLTLKNANNNNKHFLLIRCPISQDENQWTNWEKEAIELKLFGPMEHN